MLSDSNKPDKNFIFLFLFYFIFKDVVNLVQNLIANLGETLFPYFFFSRLFLAGGYLKKLNFNVW